jgi:hypothetical protein
MPFGNFSNVLSNRRCVTARRFLFWGPRASLSKRKANWIGHILRRTCLLQQVIEGKMKRGIEVTGRWGRWRQRKLLDDLKERRGYSHLKEEALDCTVLPWYGAGGRQIRGVRWVDFFLFPRLTSIMKGARFTDVAAIQERVTAVLWSIPKEAFADSFQKLYERYQQCVVKDCDFFKTKLICLYLLFCLFSGTIHRTF